MKKKKIILLAILLLLSINVYALTITEHGSGGHRLRFNFDDNGYPVTSVKINGVEWVADTMEVIHEYLTNDNVYNIVILAGKKGESFPRAETPGGYDDYGTYQAIPNPNDNPDVVGDEYLITMTITNYHDESNNDFEFFGTNMTDGPEPQIPATHKTSNLNVTINGEKLEWHELSDEASHFTFAFENQEMFFLDGRNLTFTRNASNEIIQGRTTNSLQIQYDYTGNTITLYMHSNPSECIESMTINGVNYHTPNTRDELINHFDRDLLGIAFDIRNIPVEDNYEIVINARHLEGNDQLTGGFGWNYSADGDVDGASDRIPHGKIEFVSAKYNNVTYTSVNDFKAANKLFEWHDAIKKDHYSEEDGDRSQFGYTFFPTGTEVTIRIIPDSGYQLVGLRNSGQEFVKENEPGVYTFIMPGGSAALQANFIKTDDVVSIKANRVNNGSISNVQFNNGTAKLEVDNVVSMSPQREEKFVEAANGYEIDNYLEISLYNTIYKGGMKDDNNQYLAWDTEITNLNKKASVELEMNDLNANEVAIIHEKHDENGKVTGYEVIDAEYNQNTHKVVFETDSFSTYAIAVKGEGLNPDEKEIVNVIFDTRGGNNIEAMKIQKGTKVQQPQDPTNNDMHFAGWFMDEAYHDEFDFNSLVNQDLTLFAKWSSDEQGDKTETYMVNDDNGNSITFKEIPEREYELTIVDYLSYSKEQVMELADITEEQYDEIFDSIKKAASKEGTLISMLEITVVDKEDKHNITQGPLTIKVKLTDAMKKYNSFKLLYLTDDMTIENIVELKVEGDYLVGTLPHLSQYLLVGNNILNPQTGDYIINYVILFIISTVAFIIVKKKMFS